LNWSKGAPREVQPSTLQVVGEGLNEELSNKELPGLCFWGVLHLLGNSDTLIYRIEE